MKIKAGFLKAFGTGLLALLLTLVSTYTIHFPWVISSEQDLLTYLTYSKKKLNHSVFKDKLYDSKYIEKNFFLVDVSYDFSLGTNNQLKNTFITEASFEPRVAITDRRKLCRLFRWLVNHPKSYSTVVCDLLFEDSSASGKEVDAELGLLIERLQIQNKIVLAGDLDIANSQFIPQIYSSIKNSNQGFINKITVDDYFFKYSLVTDDSRFFCLPLKIHQKLDTTLNVSNSILGLKKFSRSGHSFAGYNTIIPEILFDKEDFSNIKTFSEVEGVVDNSIGMATLGESSDTSILNSILTESSPSKRAVFVGSFSTRHPDVHKTIYGDVNGSMIILNIFHSLVTEQQKFRISQIFFLFLVYYFIIFWIFFHVPVQKNSGWFSYLWYNIVLENRHYLLLLLATVFSYYYFNRILNIIVLTLFFVFLESTVRIARKYKLVTVAEENKA